VLLNCIHNLLLLILTKCNSTSIHSIYVFTTRMHKRKRSNFSVSIIKSLFLNKLIFKQHKYNIQKKNDTCVSPKPASIAYTNVLMSRQCCSVRTLPCHRTTTNNNVISIRKSSSPSITRTPRTRWPSHSWACTQTSSFNSTKPRRSLRYHQPQSQTNVPCMYSFAIIKTFDQFIQ